MRRRNEKGAITLFVLIAGLSFIAFLTTMLAVAAVRRQAQIEATKQAKEIYSRGDANTIYEDYFVRDGAIPIYTPAQLNEMCTGHEVAINEENGKIYTFSSNSAYVLMNDLAFECEGIWPLPEFTGNGRLEWNGKTITIKDTNKSEEVYYYYNSKNDYAFPVTKEGYSYAGLKLCYDGVNNTGNGHSSSPQVWKDLSGNGYDGTPIDITWDNNSAILNGTSSWVNCGERNYDNITLEVVFCPDTVGRGSMYSVISNIEVGGYRIGWKGPQGRTIAMYLNNSGGFTEKKYGSYESIGKNKQISVTLTYDGNVLRTYTNGKNDYEEEINDTIITTTLNTVLAIGCNPKGNAIENMIYQGKIYAVRVYDRALTDKEVNNNFKKDYAEYYDKGYKISNAWDGHVTEGLVQYFDVFNREAFKDRLYEEHNITWGDNYAEFNGTSSWIDIGYFFSDYQTVMVTFSTENVNGNTVRQIFGNQETGGHRICISGKNAIYGRILY